MISFVPGVYSGATARQEAGKGVAVVRTLRILWMTMVPYVPRRDDTFRETVSTLPFAPSNSRNVSLLHFSATSFHGSHYHPRVSLITSFSLENKRPINNDESRIPARKRNNNFIISHRLIIISKVSCYVASTYRAGEKDTPRP